MKQRIFLSGLLAILALTAAAQQEEKESKKDDPPAVEIDDPAVADGLIRDRRDGFELYARGH